MATPAIIRVSGASGRRSDVALQVDEEGDRHVAHGRIFEDADAAHLDLARRWSAGAPASSRPATRRSRV